MSTYDDMARDAGYTGDQAAQVADMLEQQHRAEVEAASGSDDYWRCHDCACINRDDEAFCYRCGAGHPEEAL